MSAGFISCEGERSKEIKLNENGWTEWAGCRRSSYGFNRSNPSVSDMTSYVDTMSGFYNKAENKKATGALVWIVGEVTSSLEDEVDDKKDNGLFTYNGKKYEDENDAWAKATIPTSEYSCRLNFPEPSGVEIPKYLKFGKSDFNEDYLTAFDEAGYDVWLQVEAGFVDIVKLATVVMTKYKDHPCVKGFGIDAEWYRNVIDGYDGTAVTDTIAKSVDEAVKKINSKYSVFVKHWDTNYLPKKYRGVNNDMIFVTDSQYFDSLKNMKKHYSEWAEHYEPNPVFFQIGYYARPDGKEKVEGSGSDEKIWKSFDKPLKDFGTAILKSLPESEQKRGIIWVDMTFLDAYERSK